MPSDAFDIYATRHGPTAVTQETQRQILEALAGREMNLNELMEVTGKSKPTLSGIHMKELLNRELIEERPDPADGRKKWYHLRAQRIGSSDIPVDKLRQAVKNYSQRTFPGVGLPLPAVLDALALAPAETAQAQAVALGRRCKEVIETMPLDESILALRGWLQEGGLEVVRLDLERPGISMRPPPACQDPDGVARAVAGLIEGVLRSHGHEVAMHGEMSGGTLDIHNRSA